jgi:hypothetical protein
LGGDYSPCHEERFCEEESKKLLKKTADHLQKFCRKQGLLLERVKHASDFKSRTQRRP